MARPLKPPAQETVTYHGEVWTDARGYATPSLPAEAAELVQPLDYELRDLDGQSDVRVTAELQEGRFTIETDEPHVKVAWRITGRPQAGAAATATVREGFGENPTLPGSDQAAAERAQLSKRSQKRFVLGFLVACLGVLAAVLSFNIVIDPFVLAGTGIVPTAVEPDRSIKLDLLQKLRRAPQILIMGSSRSRLAQPSFLRKLTGHTAFNAGVTGGTSADEWVFTRFAADLFPHQRRRYIWFTDVGLAGGGVLPQLAHDPRARRYLLGGAGFGLGDVKTYLSTDATKASFRVFQKCVLGSCRSPIQYRVDGSLTSASLDYLPEHAKSLRQSVAKLIAAARADHKTLAQTRREIDKPGRFFYFERALAFMNSRGEVPVLVLNPVYPTVLAQLDKHGYPGRQATLEKVAQLHKRFRFVFVDCQDIRTWGGTSFDWENATHVSGANMRRMLRYIVAHSDGALR